MIQRLQLNLPLSMRGSQEFAPPELEEYATVIANRIDTNLTYLMQGLRQQVVCDPEALPAMSGGAAAAPTTSTATNVDIEAQMAFAALSAP